MPALYSTGAVGAVRPVFGGVLVEKSKEKTTLSDAFREAWSLALAKVEVAEEEVGRILHRAGEAAGLHPEEFRKIAADLRARLAAQHHEFERSVDDGIHRAIGRLKVPRREDLEAIRDRVARAGERLEALRTRGAAR